MPTSSPSLLSSLVTKLFITTGEEDGDWSSTIIRAGRPSWKRVAAVCAARAVTVRDWRADCWGFGGGGWEGVVCWFWVVVRAEEEEEERIGTPVWSVRWRVREGWRVVRSAIVYLVRRRARWVAFDVLCCDRVASAARIWCSLLRYSRREFEGQLSV